MAGFYIHIPFCRKLCYYCDFHFTVSFKQKDRVIAAIVKEIENRKKEFGQTVFDSIYFGGGTPSALDIKDLQLIFDTVYTNYKIAPGAEVSFEANPDDLSNSFLNDLKLYTPVNRLSVGVQSFRDTDLVLMNRRHTAEEAISSMKRSIKFGFTNLNLDLIYGIPGLGLEDWQQNLEIFAQLNIPHLSAYHLTFEPKTVFSQYLKKGKLQQVPEEKSVRQFEILMRFAERNGYEHYEISNFARGEAYSKHNLAYWTGKTYIGIGPSAHSYTGGQRRWNVANNSKYCESIENNTNEYFEIENIDNRTAYNDYILTSLRTKWGINPVEIQMRFGDNALLSFQRYAKKFIDEKSLFEQDGNWVLNKQAVLIADYIISELMITD